MTSKRRLIIGTSILITGLVLLTALYWFGFIEFHGSLPSFNPSPTNPSPVPSEPVKSTKMTIENIKARFNKIYADIKNVGDADATKVNWSISVTGGLLKRIDLLSIGSIETLSVNMKETVHTDKFLLGFGRITIEVTVEAAQSAPVTTTAHGFLIFFFIIGVRFL